MYVLRNQIDETVHQDSDLLVVGPVQRIAQTQTSLQIRSAVSDKAFQFIECGLDTIGALGAAMFTNDHRQIIVIIWKMQICQFCQF